MIYNSQSPRFFIVGVGPGDPDLLTLKAVRIINLVDIIAYPNVSGGKSRARDIVTSHITKVHKELPFHLPMEINPSSAQIAYERAAEKIIKHLKSGCSIALLCEGDPFFYGSAIHIYTRVACNFMTCVVPGISSLTAGPAAAGLPLASRNDVIKILPATLDTTRLEFELENCEAAIIIKLGRHFDKVSHTIRLKRLEKRALLVSTVSHGDQHIISFDEFYRQNHTGVQPYFSMVLISMHKRVEP